MTSNDCFSVMCHPENTWQILALHKPLLLVFIVTVRAGAALSVGQATPVCGYSTRATYTRQSGNSCISTFWIHNHEVPNETTLIVRANLT